MGRGLLLLACAFATSFAQFNNLPFPDGNLNVYMLPTGEGDAKVIQCPDGSLTIHDLGGLNAEGGRFWGSQEITTFLTPQFGNIANVVVTTNRQQNYKYIPDVLTSAQDLSALANIYISCSESALPAELSDWLTSIGGSGLVRTFNGGMACGPNGIPCGAIDFCPNNPNVGALTMGANQGGHCEDGGNTNTDSVVTKLSMDQVSVLLPGNFEDESSSDADGLQEKMVNFYGAEMQVTIAQLAHQGADTNANKPLWMNATMAPALVSTGDPWYATYGHPRCSIFDIHAPFTCRPLAAPLEGNYCGDNAYLDVEPEEARQGIYSCGITGNTVDTRLGNDFAFYTTTQDTTFTNVISIKTNGTSWAVRSLSTQA